MGRATSEYVWQGHTTCQMFPFACYNGCKYGFWDRALRITFTMKAVNVILTLHKKPVYFVTMEIRVGLLFP